MKKNIYGQIQIYTGAGKGKTTAALGLAIRAAGWGKRVAIVFFDKGGSRYGERKILDKISFIDYYACGQNRIGAMGRFRFGITDKDKKEARRGLAITKKILKEKKYDIIILDEFNTALALKMFTLKKALEIINAKPQNLELILTGRNAHPQIMAKADLISIISAKKHYLKKGIKARPGIEY